MSQTVPETVIRDTNVNVNLCTIRLQVMYMKGIHVLYYCNTSFFLPLSWQPALSTHQSGYAELISGFGTLIPSPSECLSKLLSLWRCLPAS